MSENEVYGVCEICKKEAFFVVVHFCDWLDSCSPVNCYYECHGQRNLIRFLSGYPTARKVEA